MELPAQTPVNTISLRDDHQDAYGLGRGPLHHLIRGKSFQRQPHGGEDFPRGVLVAMSRVHPNPRPVVALNVTIVAVIIIAVAAPFAFGAYQPPAVAPRTPPIAAP